MSALPQIVGVTQEQADAELAQDMARFALDPLGFVEYAYRWQVPGTSLANQAGPDEWQREFLHDLGEEVRKRAFNGIDAVEPVRMAISSGHGIGKLGPKSLILNTPGGIRRWGDLRVGDEVFGSDGKPTRIVARYEQGVKPIYRVTFDDGSSTLCGLEHLWNVRGRNERRTGSERWATLTTGEILRLGVKRPNGAAEARQWEIPVQGAAEFPERKVGLHPYLMGLWLSDGSKGAPRYTKPYAEVTERVRSLGYQVTDRPDGKSKHVQGIAALVAAEPVCALGSHERFIPEDYKFNSVANRMELLRGLLDGDGEVYASGSIGYSTTSEPLATDVAWLVRSVGGKAQLHPTVKHGWYPGPQGERIECRDCHRLTISLPFNPFTLEHRRAAYKASEARYQVRWIDSIVYSHDEDSMCIKVNREDGLYLCNDFIVTHNTTEVAWLVDWLMSTRPNCRGTITANTFPQLMSKTWPALKRWTALCITGHWFVLTAEKMFHKQRPDDWFCMAQTCREENSEAFAGQHAADSSSWYIFDEASAIPDGIYEVAEGGLTDGEPHIYLFGNPTRSSGKFYRACFGAERARWNTRTIDSRRSRFTNKALIAQWVADYGEDSDFVRVRVRGLPPAASDLQFIDSTRVYAAQQRPVASFPDDALVVGLDIARGGDDSSVFRFRRGLDARSVPAVTLSGEESRDSMRLATVASQILGNEYLGGIKVTAMFVDGSGVGGPIANRLQQLGFKNVFEIQFGAACPDKRHYANMRVWMWGRMRDWLANGMIDADLQLETDLTGPGYKHDAQDRLVLESKDDMKKRGLASPDGGDALALTFATYVGPRKPTPRAATVTRLNENRRGWMH